MNSNATSLQHALDLRRAGRIDQATAVCRRVLESEPANADAVELLGLLAQQSGDWSAAERLLRQAVALRPGDARFQANLAAALGAMGRVPEAAIFAAEAVLLRPDYAEGHHNLAVALELSGRAGQAIEAFRAAIRLKPNYAEAHNHLGNALRALDRLDEAAASHRRAIELRPGYSQAFGNLATTLSVMGDSSGAVESYRQAAELEPGLATAHSSLVYAMHYCAEFGPQELFEEARRWEARHARRYYSGRMAPENDRDPERRLRVGYVSPDFREHPVGRFIAPVFAARDASRFFTVCYSDAARADAITSELRAGADLWRDTRGMSDDELAGLIRRDRIDVLVDLAGHLADNRLLVFARKPAPVQVAWLGYPDTTGLSAIDYRITDAAADPPGMTERYHAEQLVRLTNCALCYRADDDSPAVTDLPALRAGYVTFGCLNRIVKITRPCAQLWSRIIAAVPGSRLLLPAGEKGLPRALRDTLSVAGIPVGRIEVAARIPSRRQYLGLFGRIDIALDPFPYNGTTTTCDGLWMGVPHVTLAGNTCVSRAGASLLGAIEMGEFVAATADEYVNMAVKLGGDPKSMALVRAGLRERMRASVRCDAAAFTRELEAAYRRMWRGWCSRELHHLKRSH
jgi:protein O-GlcNAc transferase